jgi:hypothetical protein
MEDPHARRLVPNRGGGLEWAGAGLSRLASLPLSSDVVHILSEKIKNKPKIQYNIKYFLTINPKLKIFSVSRLWRFSALDAVSRPGKAKGAEASSPSKEKRP